MTYFKLGDDWKLGPDGIRERRSARVILMRHPAASSNRKTRDQAPSNGKLTDAAPSNSKQTDAAPSNSKNIAEPELLMVRGHDADNPSRSWWFTTGGGIAPGETPRQAAAREVWEETGIKISESELIGPVLTRTALFDFATETCRAEEVFFAAIVNPSQIPIGIQNGAQTHHGWTEVEFDLLDELAWLTPTQLVNQTKEVFPENLPQFARELYGQLITTGWDGAVTHLGLQDDDANYRAAQGTSAGE